MILKIVLSEPIPPEGRIPTAAEIKQFLSKPPVEIVIPPSFISLGTNDSAFLFI